MKHIKNVNELFGIGNLIRSRLYSDEDVAKEILNKLNNGKYRKELLRDHRAHISETYQFDIDGFFIEIHYEQHYSVYGMDSSETHIYNLYIDDKELECSDWIKKKIYKKCQEPEKNEEETDVNPVEDFRRAFRTNRRR
jgi:hypothetical protein